MKESMWSHASASVIGSSHVEMGEPCQDAHKCLSFHSEVGETLVAAVADGAGSAPRGKEGAQQACEFFTTRIEALLTNGGLVGDISLEQGISWLDQFRLQIEATNEEDEFSLRDYACTLLVGVVGPSEAVFLQVGDGSIIFSTAVDPDCYRVAHWPERGLYANSTFFATDPDARKHMQHRTVYRTIEEVAFITDGLETIALRYQDREAHSPFFRGLFPSLRNTEPGHCKTLSASIAEFLGSERVSERTDDDKTLVLATRRRAAVDPGCEEKNSKCLENDDATVSDEPDS